MWILPLGEKEFKPSFDEKVEEMKDEMFCFSDDEEGSLWIKSRK